MKLWITSKMTKIYRMDLGSCNSYLLERNGHYVLVDTGLVKDQNKLEHSLKVRKVNKLDAIFITHVHTDHAGNASYLSKKYRCTVYGPKSELECLVTGKCTVAGGVGVFSKLINYLMYHMDIYRKFAGVNNAASYPDRNEVRVKRISGQEDWDILIMKTAGHTKGSVSILVDGEVAIVGDTMGHPLVGSIYPSFAEQESQLLLSWKKLLQKRCKLYLPGHGREIKRRLLLESYSVYRQNEEK